MLDRSSEAHQRRAPRRITEKQHLHRPRLSRGPSKAHEVNTRGHVGPASIPSVPTDPMDARFPMPERRGRDAPSENIMDFQAHLSGHLELERYYR